MEGHQTDANFAGETCQTSTPNEYKHKQGDKWTTKQMIQQMKNIRVRRLHQALHKRTQRKISSQNFNTQGTSLEWRLLEPGRGKGQWWWWQEQNQEDDKEVEEGYSHGQLHGKAIILKGGGTWATIDVAHVAGVRKGRGRELGRETTRAQIPPSPYPFNACHAGYDRWSNPTKINVDELLVVIRHSECIWMEMNWNRLREGALLRRHVSSRERRNKSQTWLIRG